MKKKLLIVFLCVVLTLAAVFAVIFGLNRNIPYDAAAAAEKYSLPTSIIVGDMRIQLLSERIVRIEQKGEKGYENRPSFIVEKRSEWDNIDYTLSESESETLIKTAAYTVCLPSKALSAEKARIEDATGNVLWRFETDTSSSIYLPSPSDELKSWYFTDSPRVIPSEDGYTKSESHYKHNGWDMENKAQDIYVFLPGGNYRNFCSDFTLLTGKAEMPTLKFLGYWDSRYFEYSEASALQQIEDYKKRNYPLDVLVIDTDWRDASSGTGYNINNKLFPDMEGFLEKVHESDIAVVFNDHPEPVTGSKNLLDSREIKFRTENLTSLLEQGLDAWWYDRNWWTSLKPVDDGLSIFTTGMYAYKWITNAYYESAADGEYAVRPVIMANVDGIDNGNQNYASSLAAHRYTLQWTGDIGTASEDLRDEIRNVAFGGAEMGLSYLSSDLGGHTAEVTDDMYVRWLQYGALSPICRVHCTKPYSRMPWLYGETAEEVAHTYVSMRYRLLPLFYSLAHENYETGLPMLRRLDINYPQYTESAANDEYLLGDNILVAPFSESYAASDDYTFTNDGKSGLKGEFFANEDFSGTPEIVNTAQRVYYDWVYDAPFGLSISDYFTARWTGEITVGKTPLSLNVFSDDGVRIFIDGEKVVDGWDKYDTNFSTPQLAAGSTHTIKIEYRDGNNHAHIFVTAKTETPPSRTVFIPDGQWMDVFSGKTYTGPKTITVTHPLETSPVFVRMGTVTALADDMLNTSEKDWSHLTLDVYPSAEYSAKTVIYEDDTKSVAYKDGKFRTTDITLSAGETQKLTISPTVGSFEGELAFSSRKYTVRIHARSDWGELEKVLLNGKEVSFDILARDASAAPFTVSGGSRDNTVYTLGFSSDISKKNELELTFGSVCPDGKNAEYTQTQAITDISVRTLAPDTAKLTFAKDCADWMLFATDASGKTVSRKNGNGAISAIKPYSDKWTFDDNYAISWTDGESISSGTSTYGLVSSHEFIITLDASKADSFTFRLGGHKSLAKLTVRDRAGNVRTEVFGDLSGNFYREATISAAGEGELQVTYSLLCGPNITLAACYAEKAVK